MRKIVNVFFVNNSRNRL